MEDCERKYKEAFNMAVLEHKSDNEAVRESIERIFPQLKESEDEKIRKALFEYFTTSDNNAYYEVCGVATKKILTWLQKQGEQKPFAWSKEDKGVLLESISVLQSSSRWVLADKLKSLKDRGGCEVNCTTTKEWSEEDEDNRINAIKYLELFDAQGIHGNVATPCINWLKSLKEKFVKFDKGFNVGFSAAKYNQWKPSKEQMDALDSTLQYSQVSHNSFEQLNSLFNNLKKLREE